jgi:hypothetical protein
LSLDELLSVNSPEKGQMLRQTFARMGIFFLNLTIGLSPDNTRKELLEHFGNEMSEDFAAGLLKQAERKIGAMP